MNQIVSVTPRSTSIRLQIDEMNPREVEQAAIAAGINPDSADFQTIKDALMGQLIASAEARRAELIAQQNIAKKGDKPQKATAA